MILDTNCELPATVYRNIVSAHSALSVFDDLAEGDAEAFATAVNSTQAIVPPIVGRASTNIIDSGFAYSQAIAFPFVKANWAQSRFSDGSFPCLYASDSVMTTVYETCYHFLHELDALSACDQEVVRHRSVYTIKAKGLGVDLSSKVSQYPLLLGNNYSFCQSVGLKASQSGMPGLKALSARLDNAANFVFFQTNLLTHPSLLKSLTYRANLADKTVRVEGLDQHITLDLSVFWQ